MKLSFSDLKCSNVGIDKNLNLSIIELISIQVRFPHLPISSCWRRFVILAIFICSINFLMHPFDLALANSSTVLKALSPEKYMERGLISFQRGDFEQAILNWREAAKLYEKEGKLSKQSEAITKLSRAYQSIGQYMKALENLKFALTLARKSGNRMRIASVLGSIGDVYIAIGPADKAYQFLNKGLSMARDLRDFGLSATILNNLGNVFTSQKKYKQAIGAYLEVVMLAKKTGNHSLAAVALINAAIASAKNGQHKESKSLLDKALDQIQGLSHSHDKAYGLIDIGVTCQDLCSYLPDSRDLILLLGFKSLNEAVIVAETIGDLGALSYAWGYLGRLYEIKQRYQEALQATRRASFAAQQVHSPESLYQWQWQTGRLFKVLGKIDEAILAYRRAVNTLQSIRQEAAITYGSKKSSFRESVGPLYFELVDLLLQRAASIQERGQYEPYLIEAREKVELLKIAELRDYFEDECVVAAKAGITKLDVISKTAVVIYPILLPDRTELLVSLPDGLKRFSVPVGANALTREVRKFRKKLEKRISQEYLYHAQKLYDWLIRPLERELTSLSIDTLVFVPDGPLRTVPMAALHDGSQFLINKFALAITPGLNLTDPCSIKRDNIKILALGLTESSQGFPPLPHIIEELQTIQDLYGGKLLLNQDFILSSIEKALLDESFNIVHIASHGEFESDVKKTFLLTFDDKLTLERLDQCIGFFRFRDDPLELLTLSACETAAGDDRAALGLAGVAVKAGARSALATLWYINDQASSVLVAEFYRQLHDPSVSRSIALQRAQLKMINDPRYSHPCYWAPFLLINNWL